MYTFRMFLKRAAVHYAIGISVTVICAAALIWYAASGFAGAPAWPMYAVVGASLGIMFVSEAIAFYIGIRGLVWLLHEASPSAQRIRSVFAGLRNYPSSTIKRVLGVRMMGFLLPLAGFGVWGIRDGFLRVTYDQLAATAVWYVLLSCVHAAIEYRLASRNVLPMLMHLRKLALRLHGEELVMRKVSRQSIRGKFVSGMTIVGTAPLFLFVSAAMARFPALQSDPSIWSLAGVMVAFAVVSAWLGAKLMWQNVHDPLRRLRQSMERVKMGNLKFSAMELYAEEFADLYGGFNQMVSQLRERDRINQQMMSGYVASLAAALDARDAYTAGHSERVSQYAVQIGKLFQMAENDLENLRKTALLHDIGKIGLRDDVLLKPSALTEEEFLQIKNHPVLGESILRSIKPAELMNPFLAGVRSHHERFDGNGYPDGLKANQIPLFGRVIAIADAFDAMTSDRPYRKGMSYEEALRVLDNGKGTQWDPELTELFVDSFRKGKFRFPKASVG